MTSRKTREQAAELCSAMATHDLRDTCAGVYWIDVLDAFGCGGSDAAFLAAATWIDAHREHYARRDELECSGLGGVERWALAASMLMNDEVE